MQTHDTKWVEHFRAEGFPNVAPLGGGMEGAVYKLEDGLVAKVWAGKQPSDLEPLQAFYAELGEQSLPFATPRILRIEDVDSVTVTHEVELTGSLLQDHLAETDETAPAPALECILGVLGALRQASAGAATRRLPVLGEDEPFVGDRSWAEALAAGLDRKLASHGGPLRNALPDAPVLAKKIVRAIESLPPPPEATLHGDLCGVNVLVGDRLELLAVLDWGFLTTAGDPRFDAVVAASIFNMYGPHAQRIERQITAELVNAFGYEREILLLYRAAYAVLTNNVYDPAGQDGHFEWCVASLKRPDVVDAVETLSCDT